MSGVYFLKKDGRIVYIGQSGNAPRRISQHDKDFDSFRIIPCRAEDLLKYEKRLINYFKPELNLPTGGKRDGAGRKVGSYQNGEKKEETKVMRIPESMAPMLHAYLKLYHEAKNAGAPIPDLEEFNNQWFSSPVS